MARHPDVLAQVIQGGVCAVGRDQPQPIQTGLQPPPGPFSSWQPTEEALQIQSGAVKVLPGALTHQDRLDLVTSQGDACVGDRGVGDGSFGNARTNKVGAIRAGRHAQQPVQQG